METYFLSVLLDVSEVIIFNISLTDVSPYPLFYLFSTVFTLCSHYIYITHKIKKSVWVGMEVSTLGGSRDNEEWEGVKLIYLNLRKTI